MPAFVEIGKKTATWSKRQALADARARYCDGTEVVSYPSGAVGVTIPK